MKAEITRMVCKSCGSLLAMVLIWRLVEHALNLGLNGLLLAGGLAALAGLGGYETKAIIEAVKSKIPPKTNGEK